MFSFKRNLFLILLLIYTSFSLFAIELRKHQLYPGDFLYERQNQKGLLIYHGLGTGKTYLSLGFTERFPKKKVVVLLPRFLKSNWEIQMKSYGIKEKNRYQLVSFREAITTLKNYDFKDTIVVIDEVHKLIDLITTSKSLAGKDYGKLYFKLRSSFKILALTGTPIFNHSFDIAYIANLVAGKNILTFSPEKFREDYTKIKTGTSLVRGYFSESKLVMTLFPLTMFITLFPLSLSGGALAALPALGFFGSFLGIFMGNETFPAEKVEFRQFDSSKLLEFTKNYVSFHEVPLKNKEFYPKKIFHHRKVHYSEPQTNMFMEFVDESLGKEELKTLLLDEPEKNLSDDYLALNSVNLQKKFLLNPTTGREIGNLPIYQPKDELRRYEGSYYPYRVDIKNLNTKGTKLIEPPKFNEIYSIIKKKPGQVAVYSNYYSNGILQFAHFLDRKGMKTNYAILSPEDSVEKQIETINSYNKKQIRILLLHPEITEGVSLVATEQFHILEPLTNIALQEQVIGRAVRFESHKNLPKNRQNVSIYLWKSYVSYCSFRVLWCIVPSDAAFIRREHWQRRYSEINPSTWTYGITFIDKNYTRKDETPDLRVEKNSHTVEADMNSFKKLAKKYSIESVKKIK